MNWETSSGIEREVLLSLGNKSKSISEIAKNIGKATNTVGKYIERMELQKIIIRHQDYLKDARKSEISINKERVKIKKADIFYLRYFLISLFSLILTLFWSFSTKKLEYLFGGIIGVIFPVIYMAYMVFIEKDKIVVEKLIKSKNRKIKIKISTMTN